MDMDVRSKPAKAFGGSAERQSRCDRSHDQRGRPIIRTDRSVRLVTLRSEYWCVSRLHRPSRLVEQEPCHLTFWPQFRQGYPPNL